MKKDISYFFELFLNQIEYNERNEQSNIGYGENVMPILETYHKIVDFDERIAFREAIINLLTDNNIQRQNFAVDLCLGFFIFRDVIGKK